MILSSGSSSSNANGLIKMLQEPSKIVLGATSLRFEKTKMLSKMALLVGLPSAIEDKSMQFFFSRCKLSTGFGKGCANKHGEIHESRGSVKSCRSKRLN